MTKKNNCQMKRFYIISNYNHADIFLLCLLSPACPHLGGKANLNSMLIYMCVCVYSHPHTDCFVVSQLFSVARHVECLKLGLKPAQLSLDLVSYRSANKCTTSAREL